MNKNLAMGTGTKVAAALSLTLVGALIAVGCDADDNEGAHCETVAVSAYTPPAPPRIAPKNPVKPPKLPGPALPNDPRAQVICT